MFKARKRLLPFAATAALAVLSGAAWAGMTENKLNSDNVDVDLSKGTYYSPEKPVTLSDSVSTVTLTQNLTLGCYGSPSGYAQQPLNLATEDAAGGAILVREGQTLNIAPMSGKSVNGSLSAQTQSSLRLFGRGTTNLSGNENKYAVTFLQSGRLNVASLGALGGSEVTLAGGSAFGIVDGVGELDLRGVTIKMTRYDPDNIPVKSVTFDTGTRPSNAIKVGRLQQTARYSQTTGTGDEIELIKDGQGTLSIAGVTDHSGGILINAGTLELGAAPEITQTIEISGDAILASNVSQLANITVKPHSGAGLSVPAVRAEASLSLDGTGAAALILAGIDKSALQSAPFLLRVNLDGLTKSDGLDADRYYVKLLNSPSHGLTANDVTVAGKVPSAFSRYYYAVEPFVDADNVYAMLTKDERASEHIFDVSVFESSSQGIVSVVVANRMGTPFASSAGFKYSFADTAGYSGDPLWDALFVAEGVQYNQSRTKASFQIDLSSLKDEKGVSHTLRTGRRYEIAVAGTGGASESTGVSTVPVNSYGEVIQADSGKYVVTFQEVSVDVKARAIEPSVVVYDVNNGSQLALDRIMIYFSLCDAFGDLARISGKTLEPLQALTERGVASVTFENIPAGHYLV
ncbi:MAG: autotransporter-associated beta strand repeat-containing protein, partial [Synergistaceae bacterium]|nr:autotransporter-associated beta strand repeat-containing protein [Synergistaceae bacterium]